MLSIPVVKSILAESDAVCVLNRTQSPNPDAVPLLVIVAPDGILNVSPESPKVNAVPEPGLILLVFISVEAVMVAGRLTVASVAVSVTPLGTVIVSPLSPNCNAAAEAGETLSSSTVGKFLYGLVGQVAPSTSAFVVLPLGKSRRSCRYVVIADDIVTSDKA